jgi:hypothetical protein
MDREACTYCIASNQRVPAVDYRTATNFIGLIIAHLKTTRQMIDLMVLLLIFDAKYVGRSSDKDWASPTSVAQTARTLPRLGCLTVTKLRHPFRHD